MPAEELRDATNVSWAGISAPTDGSPLSGIRVPTRGGRSAVYVAVDSSERRHLLVELSAIAEPIEQRPTRGLQVVTDRFQIGDLSEARFVDLACLDQAFEATFSALALDVAQAVETSTEPRAAISRVLDRWRWFWSVEPAGLGPEAALGLFGELWFLLRWCGNPSSRTVAFWQGPAGSRHDFQGARSSVEVKTGVATRETGLSHHVANLEQLSPPEQGPLYLFSLHVADDVLAGNTLPGLVGQIEGHLTTEDDGLRLFRERLALAGYSPAHADRYERPLRIVGEGLYEVDATFPRLTLESFPEGLPPGVTAVSYNLVMSACVPWLRARSPADEPSRHLM